MRESYRPGETLNRVTQSQLRDHAWNVKVDDFILRMTMLLC